MAKDGDPMTATPKGKKRWPPEKAIPRFKSPADEDKFWLSHDFDDLMDARGEEVVYEPQATRRARTHVYRVRLDDQEMAALQVLAKGHGVTASVVLRELVRAEARRRSHPAGAATRIAGAARRSASAARSRRARR
jgi:hypothetical protein